VDAALVPPADVQCKAKSLKDNGCPSASPQPCRCDIYVYIKNQSHMTCNLVSYDAYTHELQALSKLLTLDFDKRTALALWLRQGNDHTGCCSLSKGWSILGFYRSLYEEGNVFIPTSAKSFRFKGADSDSVYQKAQNREPLSAQCDKRQRPRSKDAHFP
jgi:hypothetical protein